MKKLFYLLAAIAVVAFVGCSKDNEDVKVDNIIGSWKVYKEYWDEKGFEEGRGEISNQGWEYPEYFYTFETNGLFTIRVHDTNYSGRYTLDGKTLTVVYADVNNTYTIKTLTTNEMVWIIEEKSDNYEAYGEIYLQRNK